MAAMTLPKNPKEPKSDAILSLSSALNGLSNNSPEILATRISLPFVESDEQVERRTKRSSIRR